MRSLMHSINEGNWARRNFIVIQDESKNSGTDNDDNDNC